MQRYWSQPQIWGILLGNILEHFDSALYAVLAPFIGPLFFPSDNYVYSLVLAYGIIPAGMLARPLGAVCMGYLGDCYGRRTALLTALGGMAGISFCMAFLPTYAQVGLLAPILLLLCRMGQNLFSAGETVGAALSILELTETGRHNLVSSLFCASTMVGILLASASVTVLSLWTTIESTWRLLYLFGLLTGLVALFLRRYLPETLHVTQRPGVWQHVKALWHHRQASSMIIIAAGFSYACYSIALGFINGFVPLVSSFTKAEVTAANTVLLVVDFALLPVFGYLAQKWSREKLMMSAAAAALLSGYPIFILLPGSGLATIMLLRTLLVAVGVAFAATYHAWAQSLVPAEDRFTVCAVAYALGCQLLGGFTGSLSLWLYSITGDPSAAAWYWMFLGLAAALAVWRSQAFVPNAPLARSHANASQNSAGLRTHPEA